MKPNPYEPPETPSADETGSQRSQRIVRRGVPLAIAVVWNSPLAALLLMAVMGTISPSAAERGIAAWTLSIPAFAVALIIAPPLQRLVFTPQVDMRTMRAKLCGLAALWLAIFGVWLLAELVGGG